MLFTERIQLIQDLETEITQEVSETLIIIPEALEMVIQMEVSDKVTLEVSDSRVTPEDSETVIPEASEIHSLTEVSVILFLSQDRIINNNSQDIIMAVSDPMIQAVSDPVEVLTPVAEASEEVLQAVEVASDPVAEAEAASDNLSN